MPDDGLKDHGIGVAGAIEDAVKEGNVSRASELLDDDNDDDDEPSCVTTRVESRITGCQVRALRVEYILF